MNKKIISSALALGMVVSMGTTAFATQDVELGQGTDVPVELTVTAATFSVTVPSVLPITVNGEGEVTVADEVKIINNSQGKVEVKKLEVTAQNGWTLEAMDADYVNMPVNSKVLGMSFNDADASTDDLAATFDVIGANSELEFTYNANLAPQAEEISGEDIASAVFTIGWYEAEVEEIELITFSIESCWFNETFTAEKGMTWEQWVGSEYDDVYYNYYDDEIESESLEYSIIPADWETYSTDLTIGADGYIRCPNNVKLRLNDEEGEFVKATDVIIAGQHYYNNHGE